MLHHSTEYRLNGGAWIEITPDEVAGSGKTFTISGLSPGSYNVEMRLTPLVGGGPSVVSDSFTLTVVSGSYAAQIQAVQSESSSGCLKFIATSAQSQNKNAEQVSSLLLFIGSVAQAQTVQSESGSTSSNILGSASESQLVQSESVLGIQTFSGSASQSQNKQTNVVTSAETFAGSVTASQNKQTSVIVSYETFSGTVAESQQKQVESVSGDVAISSFTATVAQGQSKQTEASTSIERFDGVVSQSQTKQQASLLETSAYTFDGAAGVAVDTYSSFFTKKLIGAGSANLDGSGHLIVTGNVAEDGALVYKTDAVDILRTKKYKIRASFNGSLIDEGNGGTALQIINSATIADPLGSGSDNSISVIDWFISLYGGVLHTSVRHFNNSGLVREWDVINNIWSAAGSGTSNAQDLNPDTYYDFVIYTTNTGWSAELLLAGTPLISKTPEVPWSATAGLGSGTFRLRFGDKYSYAWKFGMNVDSFTEV